MARHNEVSYGHCSNIESNEDGLNRTKNTDRNQVNIIN